MYTKIENSRSEYCSRLCKSLFYGDSKSANMCYSSLRFEAIMSERLKEYEHFVNWQEVGEYGKNKPFGSKKNSQLTDKINNNIRGICERRYEKWVRKK